MPNIKITDQLGLNLDVVLAPASSLLKYLRDVPALILRGAKIQELQILSLNEPAVQSLQPTFSFQQPVSLGTDAPELTIGVDAGASFQVISRTPESAFLFSTDDYGENIEIPATSCYVALGFHAVVNPGIEAGPGALTFGITAGSGIAITSYRPFPLGAEAVSITEALRQCVGGFVIPADTDDIAGLPPGQIVTVAGRGSLRFSAAANLLAVANPLATLSLPGPGGFFPITQTGSVTVGAAWAVATEYQVRVQKVDAGHVRLGWYRKHDADFSVTANATAAVGAGQLTGFLPTVIGALSSNAQADFNELQTAGLAAPQASSIEQAVEAAVNRKLELSVAAEWGSLKRDEAAFLYEIDLAALGSGGKDAIRAALSGNLSSLADANALPAGITEVRSILTQARARRLSLKVNLLGIFNFASLTQLVLRGTVTFAPSTGDLVIADTATASRIQTTAVNFGADEDKLRKVMAESFLITAAYRGSRTLVSLPAMTSAHVFFRLDDHTNRQEMRRSAAIAPALGLGTAQVPTGIDDFGRTAVAVETHYDDALTRALFLDSNGAPRDHSEYERMGREAIALLVLPDGDDAFRLRPATDDQLWSQMKAQGPANFNLLLPQTQADGVRPDYLAIQWWADSMRDTAQILAQMNRLVGTAGAAPDDPRFQKLRQDLAEHLRDVAAKAHEHFGDPWSLAAMFLVSGRKAKAALHITGPRFVFSAEPAGVAAV